MQSRAHIIVVGNAKGGSGKSTTAMHVAVRLLCLGKRVAMLDLDDRQQTLARYMENRQNFATRRKVDLPMPTFAVIHGSGTPMPEHEADTSHHAATYAGFCAILEPLLPQNDFIVLDCPGSDTYLARLAHGCADTLLTPLNDSFIDLDLLARVDPETHAITCPSWYSEMVWEQRKRRFLVDQHHIDWVVLRNRLSHTDARNKRHVEKVLHTLSPRIGFRVGPALGERVIFRELFLKGLTLSDVRNKATGVDLTMNHLAAHQEVKDLVSFLKLPMSLAA